MRRALAGATAVVSSLAVAIWLGGLVALGAVTAPIVFAVVSMPQSADAMTLVFRRFDAVAMTCAAVAVACEAVRAASQRVDGRTPGRSLTSPLRGAALAVAAALTTYEGASVSPRIAELHASGVIRGLGLAGTELSRLHDRAELCGKATVLLLCVVLALQAWGSAGRAVVPPK
jgi:hypothetical protein